MSPGDDAIGPIFAYFFGMICVFTMFSVINKSNGFGLARLSFEAEKNFISGDTTDAEEDIVEIDSSTLTTKRKCDLQYSKSLMSRSKFYGLKMEVLPAWLSVLSCCPCFAGEGTEYSAAADFWFYLCNHHSLLSMGFGCSDNKFSRLKKRVQFIGAQGLSFVLYSFGSLLEGEVVWKFLYQYLVVLPLMFVITEVIYMIIVCPCIQKANSGSCLYNISCAWCSCIRNMYKKCGFFVGLSLSLSIGVTGMALAAYSNPTPLTVLGTYIYEMHVVASITEVIMVALLFMPLDEDPSAVMKLLNTVLGYGEWCNERRARAKLSDKDLEMNVSSTDAAPTADKIDRPEDEE